MQHHFDVEVAQEYGIFEAVILNHLLFWLRKNEAEDKCFIDGKYWSFYSIEAMKQLFPYASDKKIRNALAKLQASGLIEIANHNKNPFDRTSWYTLTEKGKCICLKGQIEVPKRANENFPKGQMRSAQNGECLNKDNERDNERYNERNNIYVDSAPLNEAINLWLTYKKECRQTYTKTGIAQLIKKVNRAVEKYGEAYVIQTIEDCIGNRYAGLWFDNGRKEKHKLDNTKTDLDDVF